MRMIAVFTVVVVRMRCNAPMTSLPWVGIAFCKSSDGHDTHAPSMHPFSLLYHK
nr:MAG TPA: hypothetical protein [Caudoviricetes sp.]